MRKIVLNENDAGQRIDKFLFKIMPEVPKSLVYKSLRKKQIKVNKKGCQISYKLVVGDVVEIYLSDEFFNVTNLSFVKIRPKLDIVYEDSNIIVVNKPAGMLVHEDKNEKLNTLINHIKAYLYNQGEYDPWREASFSPALCHRIDRNTTGLIISAKNAESLRIINDKIKCHEIRKFYMCLLNGMPKQKEGLIDQYLFKDSKRNKVFVYDHFRAGAVRSLTKYKVIRCKRGLALVEAELITGKTHQLRAHFARLNHPIVGDGKYGTLDKNTKNHTQALCAYKIIFNFQTESGILNYLNKTTISCCPEFDL